MSSFCDKLSFMCVLIVMVQLIRVAFKHFYRNFLQVGLNLSEQGKWAVITGATDGLGKAYAEALAAKKINVILISRTMEKLKTVADDIEKEYKVETRIIKADFTNTSETYSHIEKNLHGYEIGILVNNVGMSYPNPTYFLDMEKMDTSMNSKIINCNIFSVTNMCKMVLPGMIERRKGVIINISSAASQIPSPLLAVYSATKAYIDKLSKDLNTEYGKKGITIQSVLPGLVATKMAKIRKSTLMAPTPELYVKHALKTVGFEECTMGYFPHQLLVLVIHSMEFVCDKFARNYIIRIMEKLRDRALKKQNK